jgi:hypothetical protein
VSFKISVSEFFENQGSSFATFPTKVAGVVRKGACELWRLYPDHLTGKYNPATSFQRGFMQSLCSDLNPPPAPVPPFLGGQCYKDYYVDCKFVNSSTREAVGCGGQIVATTRNTSPGYVRGRIISIGFEFYPQIGAICAGVRWEYLNSGAYVQVFTPLGKFGTGGQVLLAPGCANKGNTSYGYSDGQNLLDIVVTPVDGVDDCGDIPSNYPDTQLPDSYTYNDNIEVDESTSINVSFDLKNKPNGGFSFPLVFFSPDFNFDVALDAGGFTFNTNISPGDDDEPGKPPVAFIEDFVPESVELDSPPDEDPCIITPPEYLDAPLILDGLENLKYIDISVTQTASNVAVQTGFPGEDIHFPGFIVFRSGGKNVIPRYPIHHLNNRVAVPPHVDGYAIRIYEGYNAIVKLLVVNPECLPPEE